MDKNAETVFKRLKWAIDRTSLRGDGKYNGEKAVVEIKLADGGYEVYRTYLLHRGPNDATDDIWSLLILDGGEGKRIEVKTLENGRKVAEEDYQAFMQDMFNGLTKYILTSGPIQSTDNGYCEVVEEHFAPDGQRSYTHTTCSSLEEAETWAGQVAERLQKVFHNQDRVFIKVGDVYYNPNKRFSDGYGMSWA